MASPRSQARIEARIVERVAHCCQFELNDPRSSFVTITGCKVSADLSLATLSYTVLGDDSDKTKVAHMLEHASGFVRKQLGRVLKTRRIPQLRWIYDESIQLQLDMEAAIANALAKDKLINPAAHPEPPAAKSVKPDESEDFEADGLDEAQADT